MFSTVAGIRLPGATASIGSRDRLRVLSASLNPSIEAAVTQADSVDQWAWLSRISPTLGAIAAYGGRWLWWRRGVMASDEVIRKASGNHQPKRDENRQLECEAADRQRGVLLHGSILMIRLNFLASSSRILLTTTGSSSYSDRHLPSKALAAGIPLDDPSYGLRGSMRGSPVDGTEITSRWQADLTLPEGGAVH